MAKKDLDRLALLAADISSPRVVSNIDKALEELRQEWMDLLDLRKMAVRRHGESGAPPSLPALETSVDRQLESNNNSAVVNPLITISDLIFRYRTDERSPFHTVRYRSRLFYDTLMSRIEKDYGDRVLAQLKAPDFESFHATWIEGGKASMAHATMGMLRQLCGFGARVLADAECERLVVILSKVHFKQPPSRTERLTEQHVIAIRKAAHEKNRPRIALAQALQFELGLAQRDVIGEWVPFSEPGESDVMRADEKWLRGIRWEEIDNNLILRHPASVDSKEVVRDLRLAPMVLEELKKIYDFDLDRGDERGKLPWTGPVIVADISGVPWTGDEYRRLWRIMATAGGVPKTVRNMDSKPRLTTNNKPIRPEWTGPPTS